MILDVAGDRLDIGVGPIDLMFVEMQAVLPVVQDGKATALAVAGSKRSPLAPQVPTTTELNLKGIDVIPWLGAFAPAGARDGIIEWLHTALQEAMSHPDVQQKLQGLGIDIRLMSPAETRRFQVVEREKWLTALKSARIEPQ